MSELEKEINALAETAETARSRIEATERQEELNAIRIAAEEVGKAWSGGWLGYHSRVYIRNLAPRLPGQYFDTDWGPIEAMSNRTAGDWAEFDFDYVIKHILQKAGNPDLNYIHCQAEIAGEEFEKIKIQLLPLVAALAHDGDEYVLDIQKKIKGLESCISRQKYVELRRPRQQVTRDMRASSEGFQVPPHIAMLARVFELTTYGSKLKDLGDLATQLASYIRRLQQLKGMEKHMGTNVFIGHGRSRVWRELKDFLKERLHLDCIEFNSSTPAGKTTVERLEEMLDESNFAFLMMTAEDTHADGSQHARENVIHEAGLFQGRLGFQRAIVLLEEGCQEFSNITGLVRIQFPKGKIDASFEEIRRVLEREDIIQGQ